MRFMLLMIPGEHDGPGGGNVEAIRAMGHFNEELEKAGQLVDLGGLTPPSAGARVVFKDSKPTAMDGPFAEAKEVIGGYWILDLPSQTEAVELAKRAPVFGNATIEIRKLYDFADFPTEFQESAGRDFPAMKARRERLEASGR